MRTMPDPAAEEPVAPPDALRWSRRKAGRRSPSSHRWVLLLLLCAITVINFIDRQTVSVLAPVIKASFHLSNSMYGSVVAAFQFGMTAGELPMGWLMDWVGSRVGLFVAVLWWSAATAAQAFARTGVQLGSTFFWMGTGECGNTSGATKTIFEKFRRSERTLAIGVFNGGSVIASVIAAPFIIFLMQHYGFRMAFLVPAMMGVVWAGLWWLLYPSEKAGMGPAVDRTPFSEILAQPSAWAVMLCRLFVGPVIQFYWFWLPSYLYSVRHLSMSGIGAVSWIPYFLGSGGGIAAGWFAGILFRRGFAAYDVRRVSMLLSSCLCFASLLVPLTPGLNGTLVVMSVAIFGHYFVSANMFGAVTDLFPAGAVGRATGLTGVAGGLSGLLFPLLTGVLVDRISYTPVFFLAAGMPMAGTLALFALAERSRFSSSSSTDRPPGIGAEPKDARLSHREIKR